MGSHSTNQIIRLRNWQVSVAAVILAIVFGFHQGLIEIVRHWTKADYSHGFLVPPFVGWFLWKRWAKMPDRISWPRMTGLFFFLAAMALYAAGTRYNKGKETVQGVAIIVALAGVVWMFLGGRRGLRWALPGLLFLLVAVPLPHFVEQHLSWYLRTAATRASTFLLQFLGFPCYHSTLDIFIGSTKLEVQAACSGLSMLYMFIATCWAIVLLCPPSRPWTDRLFILVSAIPIAVVCNIGRIVVTGLVYHAGWKALGDLIVHDLAGWLMMPFALLIVWALFRLIDWLYWTPDYVSTEEFAKVAFTTAAQKFREEAEVRAVQVAAWKAQSAATRNPPRPIEPTEPPS